MNTHKIISWTQLPLSYILFVILFIACTDSFEGYNTNKHEATEEMMEADDLKTGSFFTQMQKNVVLFKDGGGNESSDYQVAQGLSSDLFSGYIAPTGTWYSGSHNGSYNFITGWIEQSFTKPFSRVMPAWQEIVKIANEHQRPQIAALATVIKVEAMHRVTDAYGPIPYINYGSGSLSNNYDSQEEVYKKFFEELDEAIDVLTDYVHGNPSATILEDYDLVYSGDATKWVKFANTLRLRLALRVRFADPSLAEAEAKKISR
ncbi:MAG: SusD/RagB family nutrient-binding outer membrane lipoprotein [Bacteroides sp.]|nr:SusD/RagB family nutrient-binding outer membrane lipoprotein [Bacteroides sp.]